MLISIIVVLYFAIETNNVAANGLYCYQCSTEAIIVDGPEPVDADRMNAILNQESCESFTTAFSWSNFAIVCSENEVCGKTVSYGAEIRGCVSRNDSSGRVHPLGCGAMISNRMGPSDSEFLVGDEICLCDTNMCNNSFKDVTGIYFVNSFLLLVFILNKIQSLF